MKVWICDNRDYSSGGNQAVFSSKEVAEKVSKAFHWNEPTEFELDPETPKEALEGKLYWTVIFYFDQNLNQTGFRAWPKEQVELKRPIWGTRPDGGKNFIIYLWAEDKDVAVKIGADIMAQYPYREEAK